MQRASIFSYIEFFYALPIILEMDSTSFTYQY